MRPVNYIPYIAALVVTAACATAGATYKSGVAPKSFDRPPFYAGASAPASQRVAHLPIRYQSGAEQAGMFEPRGEAGSAADALVTEMNAYLDSIAISSKLSPKAAETGTAPDVHFGCLAGIGGDCIGEGEPDNTNRQLHLSVGRPSDEWISWFASSLDTTRHDGALVIALEIGQYWPRQKGLGIHKEIRLGTDYAASVPWLTSLEKPVPVVQLTGALVGRDGRAIRIGAEGLMAKRANLLVSALGAQMLVTDDDIAQLRTLRREDLPGAPLVWQVALRNLVTRLTAPAPTTDR